MTRAWIGLAGVGLQLLVVSDAHAIIRRHDVEDARFVVDAEDYPAVVDLFEPGDCIGTLVHESYLLTVAHCAVDLKVGDSLTIGAEGHAIAEVLVHPKWKDEADAFDIALVRLDAPIMGIDPVPLYRGDDEVGALVTLIGRGVTGTGLEGEPGGHDDAELRQATNVVVGAGEHFIEITLEEPGQPGITELEGVGAAGDSGGPVFVEVEGKQFLAGLNSWGDGGSCFEVGEYHASDFQTRVSRYLDWLDAQVQTWPEPPVDSTKGELERGTIPKRRDRNACGCSVDGHDVALALWVPLLALGAGLRRRGPRT